MKKEVIYLRVELRKKTRLLVKVIFKATQRLPPSERERLGNKMRNEAVNASTYVAEGTARTSLDEQRDFFLVAYGSLNNISNLVIVAGKLGYLSPALSHEIKLLLTEIADALNLLVEEQQKD